MVNVACIPSDIRVGRHFVTSIKLLAADRYLSLEVDCALSPSRRVTYQSYHPAPLKCVSDVTVIVICQWNWPVSLTRSLTSIVMWLKHFTRDDYYLVSLFMTGYGREASTVDFSSPVGRGASP